MTVFQIKNHEINQELDRGKPEFRDTQELRRALQKTMGKGLGLQLLEYGEGST